MDNKKENSGRAGEVIRFLVSGGVCFLIEFGALVLLKELCRLDTLIATPIAFLVSVCVNYLLCMVWVFRGSRDGGHAARVGFLITSAIGLLLNWLLMLLFRVTLGEETVLLTVAGKEIRMYMLNKCVATLLVMIWNYFTKRAILKSGLMKRLTGGEKERA